VLIGLGLGPGDPELLTLRAVRVLREADAVYVPGRLAKSLVSPYRDAELLEFPMTEEPSRIRKCMERNAEKIAPAASSGIAVLALIGDPNFFSTFTRLCQVMEERYPGIEFRTEPGVSAITAFASVARVSFSEGFCVSDGTQPRYRIMLKVRRPREAASALAREGFHRFVLVERMYLSDMHVYQDDDLPETCDYMSVLYAER